MKILYFVLSLMLCVQMKNSVANSSNENHTAKAFAPACPGMTVTTSSDSVRCYGETNGVARVTVTGTTPFTYLWDDAANQTTSAATGLGAGTYNVVITDGNGCTENASVTVEQPNQITISSLVTDVKCYGQSNGAINLTVTGGTAPYYFNWNTGSASEDLSNLATGSYSVILSDKKGCVAVKNITVSQPQSLTFNKAITNVTCRGANNGSIDLTVNGGTSPFTYIWSNGATIEDISNLSTGTYSVSVSDINNCTGSTTATVTEPLQVLALSVTNTNPVCYDANSGNIDLKISGGTGPFTYSWSNGYNGEDPYSIGVGSYEAIVTDYNGCKDSITTSLTAPSQIILTSSSTNVSACGLSDGTATISASGGTGTYTYLWNNGAAQTTTTATNLGAGTYSVLVKDGNNCAVSASVNVIYNGGLTADSSVTDVSCYAGTNGSITVNVSGGVMPYTYVWSNSSNNSATVNNLAAGTYAVTITDVNNCTFFKTAVVSQPQAIVLDLTVENPDCYRSANGSITVTPTGGTSPYTYSWSTSENTNNISSLDTGSYSITVTDFKNCSATASSHLTEPAVLALTLYEQDVKCFGGNDGNIQLSINGGSSPFSYLWNNNETTQNIDSLLIGTYTVEVTDVNGCRDTKSILVSQPTALQVSAAETHSRCFGLNGGNIDLTVSGGTANYTYLWNNSEISQDIVGLAPGFYSVSVTDSRGCISGLTVAITEPDSIELTLSSTNADCGLSNGSASVSVVGGIPSYTYLWSPSNQTGPTASNLSAATYNITITDANNCSANSTVIVNNPTGPTVSLTVTDIKCFGGNDGLLSLNFTGLGGPYTYKVVYNTDTIENVTGITAGTYSLDSLASGTYFISVTDASGCKTTESVIVNQPAPLSISGNTTNIICYGGNTGAITATITGGVSPYSYSWNNGLTTKDLSNLEKGTYVLTVTDNNACASNKSFAIVESNSKISFTTKNHVKSTCPDTNDGSIELVPSGGKAPYSVVWAVNNSTSVILEDVKKGQYAFLVTDSLGCTNSGSVTIEAKDVCSTVDIEKIPSAFTPNGDNYNDTWIIRNIQNYTECKIDIFNRWGNLVFTSKGYTQPWDGTYNGSPAAEGTYYYVITLGEGLASQSGTVTLVR